MLAFSYRIGPDSGAFAITYQIGVAPGGLFLSYEVDPFEEEGGGSLFFAYVVHPRVSEDQILVVPAH